MGHFKELAIQQNIDYSRLSHKHDPSTSKTAARVVVKSGKLDGQCKEIYEALKRFPMHTARELSRDANLDYYIVSRRLSVLEHMGLAKKHRARVCTASGTGLRAVPWEAIDK